MIMGIGSAALSWSTKSAIGTVQNVMNGFGWGASKLSTLVVNVGGYALDNAPSLISTAAFGTLIFKGGQMAFIDPWKGKDSWFDFKNKFKKGIELKVKPINISELIKKETDAVAKTGLSITETRENDKKGLAETAQTAADLANAGVKKAENDLRLAQEALEKAEKDMQQAGNNQNVNDLSLFLEASAALDKAKKIDITALKATAADLDKKAVAAKKDFDAAAEQLKTMKDKSAAKKDDTPENFMMSFSAEQTKPKGSETQINIPLSDEALIINHENLKKMLTRSAAGISMIGIGVLGAIDSLGLSDKVLNWYWRYPANAIGYPVHFASDTIGNIAGWIAENDHWGLGKIVTAGGLYHVGYNKLYWNTKLVWFNFADKSKPLYDTKVIKQDLAKLAGAAICMSGSLYALNDFIRGN